jgi:hypothetical protein
LSKDDCLRHMVLTRGVAGPCEVQRTTIAASSRPVRLLIFTKGLESQLFASADTAQNSLDATRYPFRLACPMPDNFSKWDL